VDKFLPLHLRKKALQEQTPPPAPAVFEAEPSCGLLQPGDRVHVQVKFIPAQEGRGQEPRLEFSPSSLELGPCLPSGPGDEAQLTVTNPCSFPVEFYSLELDTQYLEEDKILLLMREDYKEEGQVLLLLLPPRAAGEALPPELLDHYAELCSSPVTHTQEVGGAGGERGQGRLETSPVSRAVARHMGVDLSPEGVAARKPQRRKSSVAASLASHYGGACFTLDGVVTEALTAGSSPACLAARQLYLQPPPSTLRRGQRRPDAPGGEAPPTPSFGGGALSVEDVSHGLGLPSPGENPRLTGHQHGALQVALGAINNRRHIYLVDLCDVGSAGREAQEACPEEQEASQWPCLQDLDEEDKEVEEATKRRGSRAMLQETPGPAAEPEEEAHWDRLQGVLQVPLCPEDAPPPTPEEAPPEKQPASERKTKREREKERERGRLEKERQMSDAVADVKRPSPAPSQAAGEEEPRPVVVVAVPHLVLSGTGGGHATTQELLTSGALPPLEEVLDGLGLGPSGPPIPPPVTFSVVPFPGESPGAGGPGGLSEHFFFLDPSAPDDSAKDVKDEDAPPVNSGTATKEKEKEKERERKDRESQQERRRRSSSKRGRKGSDTLTTFRWVVPAHGEVTLRMAFYSISPGSFEQRLTFEVLGTRRRYHLPCRGTCAYPSISREPATLFALTKRTPRAVEGLRKTYVLRPGFYEFGPLYCSKNRDLYKERKFPENTETLVIHNSSALEAEVSFCFQHDNSAKTFFLDPPAMTLQPDQKQELSIWAFPNTPGRFEDSIVCCVKDNPEPVLVPLACWGVRPELELDCKQLHFDKTLLHRGTVPAGASFSLQVRFKSAKPLHCKKSLRLEVWSYCGNNGCLDFGAVRVFKEVRLSLSMKNKGKYELAYKFTLERTEPSQPDPASMFSVSPAQGTLLPAERPTAVHVLFNHDKEVFLREQSVLRCQVIEPSVGDGGETIASIRIKVSVRSYFNRYKVTPVGEINFGPLVYGSKSAQSFTVENTGEAEGPGPRAPGEGQPPARPLATGRRVKRADSVQREASVLPVRQAMGVFTVCPCSGYLQPGAQQVVTVDCAAEQLGAWSESLAVDVSDRDPSDHPDGFPYRLAANVCVPGLGQDVGSIFEEHRFCPSVGQLRADPFRAAVPGVYVEEDNTFVFTNVLVGAAEARARFRLTNTGPGSRDVEVFDVSPGRLSLPGLAHCFAQVSFAPQTMRPHHAVFEATLEGSSSMIAMAKSKSVLRFHLAGEGHLPSVCVARPALRDGQGNPVLRFGRVLVGRRRALPLVLRNDGNVGAQ
ncbi:hypothetical protein CRUP_001409, partial [Coryphaenoides rupestris]